MVSPCSLWASGRCLEYFAVFKFELLHTYTYVGQEMLTRAETHDFTHFGEFMISPIYSINVSVLGPSLQSKDSGLLLWMSLMAYNLRTMFTE